MGSHRVPMRIDTLPPEVMRRVLVLLGSTSCSTLLCLQLVCRGWLQAADQEMWRDLLLSLCGRDIVDLAATLNDVRLSASSKTSHKDMCLNLSFFGDQAVVIDIGRGYTKYGTAGIEALYNPEPHVVQLCQPNADCDLEDLVPYLEDALGCAVASSTVVMTTPFKMSGADHNSVRKMLSSIPGLQQCRSLFFIEA